MVASAASHDRSLWSATVGEAALASEPFAGDSCVDLAVIGGITGCSTALNAAESCASAILPEAKTISWGEPGRNGGQVIPGQCNPSEMSTTTGVAAGRIGLAG